MAVRDYTVVVVTQTRKMYRVNARSKSEAAFIVDDTKLVDTRETTIAVNASVTIPEEDERYTVVGLGETVEAATRAEVAELVDQEEANSGETEVGSEPQVRSIEDAQRRRPTRG
jgi:hypothetical protein